MSPVPLIERQRALARIGEIRCGDEKQDGKVGRKLETFRLTSQHREILDRASELYGGQVKSWASPVGSAWQVVTERSVLPVMVIPGYSLKLAYELWEGASKRTRVCDGEEEAISGGHCICNAEGHDQCDTYTRLMVILPETGTSLGWQIASKGETAAKELAGALEIAAGLAGGRTFVPAQLRLTQRRGQKDGHATRFVVPVLDFNPVLGGQGASSSLSSGSALPSGYVPIAPSAGNGTSLAEGLAAAETQVLTKPPRVSLPDDDVEDDEPGAAASGSEQVPTEPSPPSPRDTDKPLTLAQAKRKMNALIGQLRDGGYIKTEQLYAALAKSRSLDVEHMIAVIESARDEEGVLHWAPLRDSLSLAEARELHGRLARLWLNVQVDEGRL